MSAATVSPGAVGVNSNARVRPRSPRPSATVISIDEARRRLRGGAALEAAIARHPASGARIGTARSVEVPVATKAAALGTDALTRQLVRTAVGVVLSAVLFAAALGAGLLLRPAQFSGDTWIHSVSQGESVWGLAEGLGLSRSLESVVEDIYSLNSLATPTLQPGQQLVLPAE